MKLTRVSLRFEDRYGIIDDMDAMGIYKFEVSTQGKPFRPNRGGDDLYSARFDLRTSGFTLQETEEIPGHGRVHPSVWTEHWALRPAPKPKPKVGFKTRIELNRHHNVYQVFDIDDYIDCVPLGSSPSPIGAAWIQLEHEYPALAGLAHEITGTFPEMESRAIKAGQLVACGHVSPGRAPHVYHVNSQTNPELSYLVKIPPTDTTAWDCPCEDIKNGAPDLPNGRRCKHMAAAWMHARLGHPPQRDEGSAAPTAEPSRSSSLKEGATHHSIPDAADCQVKVIARYADGRPAKLSDGTLIAYTAGGKAVHMRKGVG